MHDHRNLVCAAFSALAITGPSYSDEALHAWMVVVHRVRIVTHWRDVFEGALSTRLSVGELSYKITQDKDDPNVLTVVMEWDTRERAIRYARDPILANGMRAAGVEDPVHIWVCGAEINPGLANESDSCEFVFMKPLYHHDMSLKSVP